MHLWFPCRSKWQSNWIGLSNYMVCLSVAVVDIKIKINCLIKVEYIPVMCFNGELALSWYGRPCEDCGTLLRRWTGHHYCRQQQRSTSQCVENSKLYNTLSLLDHDGLRPARSRRWHNYYSQEESTARIHWKNTTSFLQRVNTAVQGKFPSVSDENVPYTHCTLSPTQHARYLPVFEVRLNALN